MNRNPPARPTNRQLQYFVAVAEYGAFGAAADALAVSQPSLSKQLALMEDELGIVLFERTSRQVKLTSMGETLLPRARAVLRELRDFRSAARGLTALFGDHLSIGILPLTGAYFMPIANRLLHKLYPNLRLAVQEGSTRQLLNMLRNGSLDAVIGTPTNDPNFVSHYLFSETLWACAASDDPLSAQSHPLKVKDLRGKPLISLSPDFRLTEIVDRIADAAGTFVNREYQGSSLDAVRQMAVMGAGVAVLPSLYALAEAVRDPEFVVRRIDHPAAKHDIALIWRQSSPIQDHCLKLAEHLIEVKRGIREARPEKFR